MLRTVRPMIAATGLALALAGCVALPSMQDLAAAAAKTAAKGKPAPAKGREITVGVTGPTDLAKDGVIAGSGGASLFKGGQIVAAGGGNLVAAGGGNIVAAGAGNLVAAGAGNLQAPAFRVMVASPFIKVKGAGVQLVGLDGTPIGKPVAVDANGNAKLKAVPDGKPLTALAAFQVGDKVYRLAVVVAPGKPAGTLMADPVNTMVEARVRDILGEDGEAAALTFKKLQRVWDICAGAGVTVKPEDLEAKDEAAVRAGLTKVWQAAIDAQVTDADEKKEIKDFMAELKAAIEAKQAAEAEDDAADDEEAGEEDAG